MFWEKERMAEKPEVSVLMPTFNDAKYICSAIESLLNQTYKRWELIVIDGSTDETPEIIKEYRDDRIVYMRERSAGQLNALHYGASFIRGRYVTLLHSDDELSSSNALENNISALQGNKYDGVFCDIIKMDGNGKVCGMINVINELTSHAPAILFLRGGSNIIPDFFFVKIEAFENVFSNYITWNMPYWLKFEKNQVNILTLKKVEPWYKYRVYSENYIRSLVGKFETVNGCLRTVIEIGKRLNFPFLKLQRLLIRVFKAWPKPIFNLKTSPPKHLRDMVRHVLDAYYSEVPKNPYFKALLGFYANFPSNRTINLQFKESEETFQGKDARIFFNLMEKKEMPPVLRYILEEAISGFGKVNVMNTEDYQKAKDLMRFLNLLASIAIK